VTQDEAASPSTEQTTAPQEGPLKVSRPGWKKTPSPESPSPSGTSPGPETGPGSAGSASSPGSSDGPHERKQRKTGESRTSSRASAKAIEAAAQGIKVAFATATTVAHQLLARDEYDVALEVYLPDEQDLEEVSKPAASLIARRMGDGPANQDVADGIALGIALVGYITKQLAKLGQARQLRRDGTVVDGFQRDTTHPEPEPAL